MSAARHRPRVEVLGDVVVDVVLAPSSELEPGTDVPGRVALRQGGSGTTTARWLGRLGARVGLIGAVGRDAAGRALVESVRADGVQSHVVRIAGSATGRIGVVVSPGGERSFVQDRGAAMSLAPEHLRASWFAGVELVHIPTYSLLGHPLGDAGRRAAEMGRAAGALVTVDLASSRPLLGLGREAALGVLAGARPDLLFTAGSEARAVAENDRDLLSIAPIAVVKRGAAGVRVLWLDGEVHALEAPAEAVATDDTTGAGDAFDAGFIAAWLAARRAGSAVGDALRSAAAAGNKVAARHLRAPRRELRLD